MSARATRLILPLILAVMTGCATQGSAVPTLEQLNLPPGFEIEVYAEVPGARSLAVAEGGRKVYVGTRGEDLYAVLDADRNGMADAVLKVASGLKRPNGVAARDGRLFVVEQHRIIRFDPDGEVEIVVPRRHLCRISATTAGATPHLDLTTSCMWRLVPPATSATISGFEGTIIRLDSDGHNLEIFARGVRNSVGFDWHPVSEELFFTDNGGDNLGDLIPPDELNRAEILELHFGYPYQYGEGVPYPQFAEYCATDGHDRSGGGIRSPCGPTRPSFLSRRHVSGSLSP